jgi:tripartite-type tricarboxylate transporter receptor subunit TctC
MVERINRELNAALAKADIKERLARAAFEPIIGSPEELRIFIKDQQELWGRTVRELGLPIE